MSKKNWAVEESDSSDEGSIEDEPQAAVVASSSSSQSGRTQQKRPQTLFVIDIGREVIRDDIGFFFENHGCRPNMLEMAEGYVAVGFDDRDAFERALMLDGKDFASSKITIVKNLPDRHSRTRPQHGGRTAGGGPHSQQDKRLTGPASTRKGRGEHHVDNQYASAGIPSTPVTRPKLNLQQRTLPVEIIGKPVAVNFEIFGGGKAHDEIEYAVCALLKTKYLPS